MNCKLYFYQENSDWKILDENLRKELASKIIITNDDSFKIFLNNYGYNAKSLSDIFPSDNSLTYEINQQSINDLKKYSEYFEGIYFRGFEIFNTLEPTLQTEFVLINKIKYILKEKKNFLFIFKKFSFSYFVIQKFLYEQGFSKDEFKIKQISCGKEIDFNLNSISKLNTFKKKYNFLNTYTKNQSSKSFDNSYTTENISFSKTIHKKQATHKIGTINKILIYKLQNMFSKNFEKLIIDKIDNNLELKQNLCLFFITPSDDYVIKPIYNIFNIFELNKYPYSIVVFDLQTKSQLEKNGYSTINLFEETYALSKSLKNNKDAIEIKKTIENIVDTKNLDLLKLENHFNPIIDGIDYSLSVMLLTQLLIKKSKPCSITCINDGTKIGNSVISVSKKCKIPSFSIITLGLTKDPANNVFKSEKICVYGTQGKEVLHCFGFTDKQIFVVGNPRYDQLKSILNKNSKIFLKDTFDINPTSKLIVLGFGRWHESDEIWMADFIKFCNEHDYEVFIKIHPTYKNSLNGIHHSNLEILKNSCRDYRFHVSIDVDLSTLLSAADLVITDHSNLGIEAMLLEKPLINANFVKSENKGFQIFRELKSSIYIEDYNELKNYVSQIFEDSKFDEQFVRYRKQFFEKWNKFNDGKASERIFELMTGKKHD